MVPPPAPRTVLLVEDSIEVARRVAGELSEIDGLRVIGPAACGADALQLFKESGPDAAVLDIGLPDISGIDVLAAIRSDRSPCFVVMFTSNADDGVRARCEELGADRFVSKRSGVRELVRTLRDWMTDADG